VVVHVVQIDDFVARLIDPQISRALNQLGIQWALEKDCDYLSGGCAVTG
jgi:hypothetical protein